MRPPLNRESSCCIYYIEKSEILKIIKKYFNPFASSAPELRKVADGEEGGLVFDAAGRTGTRLSWCDLKVPKVWVIFSNDLS